MFMIMKQKLASDPAFLLPVLSRLKKCSVMERKIPPSYAYLNIKWQYN